MTIKNSRLFVALEPVLYAKVKALSKSRGTTLPMAARVLLREGIEVIEGLGLTVLADRRAKSAKGRWLRHDEVW